MWMGVQIVYAVRMGTTGLWGLISLAISFWSLGMGIGKVCCPACPAHHHFACTHMCACAHMYARTNKHPSSHNCMHTKHKHARTHAHAYKHARPDTRPRAHTKGTAQGTMHMDGKAWTRVVQNVGGLTQAAPSLSKQAEAEGASTRGSCWRRSRADVKSESP